jgi:hypothetical protein
MPHQPDSIDLAVSDQSQVASLRSWLLELPGLAVTLAPTDPGPGELGGLDVLTVLAGSSGLVAAIKTLPDFIRSQRSGLRIETTVRGQPFVLDASNVDDLLPVLERLLDE